MNYYQFFLIVITNIIMGCNNIGGDSKKDNKIYGLYNTPDKPNVDNSDKTPAHDNISTTPTVSNYQISPESGALIFPDKNQLNDESLSELLRDISNNKAQDLENIKTIDLSNTNITGEALKTLATSSIINELINLENLNMVNTQITPDDVMLFINLILSNPTYKKQRQTNAAYKQMQADGNNSELSTAPRKKPGGIEFKPYVPEPVIKHEPLIKLTLPSTSQFEKMEVIEDTSMDPLFIIQLGETEETVDDPLVANELGETVDDPLVANELGETEEIVDDPLFIIQLGETEETVEDPLVANELGEAEETEPLISNQSEKTEKTDTETCEDVLTKSM